jgi:hypothetical protein
MAEPTTPATDGTPTNDPAAALHWAAAAIGLAEARAAQGHTLTEAEHDAYDRYQAAAHAHGHTDEQIRCYLNTELRPAVTK